MVKNNIVLVSSKGTELVPHDDSTGPQTRSRSTDLDAQLTGQYVLLRNQDKPNLEDPNNDAWNDEHLYISYVHDKNGPGLNKYPFRSGCTGGKVKKEAMKAGKGKILCQWLGLGRRKPSGLQNSFNFMWRTFNPSENTIEDLHMETSTVTDLKNDDWKIDAVSDGIWPFLQIHE